MEAGVYEEAARHPERNREALLIVVTVTVAAQSSEPVAGVLGAPSLGSAALALAQIGVAVLLGMSFWFVWVGATWLLGTRLFGGVARYAELQRALAYALVPFGLRALVEVPAVGSWLEGVGTIWSVVLSVVAVQQSMKLTRGRAISVIVAPIAAFVVVILLFFTRFPSP